MRKTREEAQKTKESILEAATEVFLDKGVLRASISDIARKAELTRGAVYWHFKHKYEIFDALHNSLHVPILEMITSELHRGIPDPIGQLKKLCVNILIDIEKNENKRRICTLFLVRADYSDELAEYRVQHNKRRKESVKMLVDFIARAQAKGVISPKVKPDLVVLSLHCYLKGIIFEYIEGAEEFSIADKAEELVDSIFIGLFKK